MSAESARAARKKGRPRRLAWLVLKAGASTALVAALAWGLLAFWPLAHIESPHPGEVVGTRGLEVIVRFPGKERAAPETLRVLLNGADVTDGFITGENGAYGRLFALLDGENLLRVEVFGRPGWPPGLLLEQTREVSILYRRPLDADRG